MIRLSRVRSRTGEMREKKKVMWLLFCVSGHKVCFNCLNFVPSYSRGCTDIVCCILFILAILGYIAVGILGKETALQFGLHVEDTRP